MLLTLHIPALATLCDSCEDPGVVVALLHRQAAPVPLLLPHLLQLQKISEKDQGYLFPAHTSTLKGLGAIVNWADGQNLRRK